MLCHEQPHKFQPFGLKIRGLTEFSGFDRLVLPSHYDSSFANLT